MKKVILCFLVFGLLFCEMNASPVNVYSTDSYDQEKPLGSKAWKMTAGDCIVYVVFIGDTEKLYIVINDKLAAIAETGIYYPGSVCETSTDFPDTGYTVTFQKKSLTRYSLSCTYPAEEKIRSSQLEIIDEKTVPVFDL